MSKCKFNTNQFHGECCVCGASVSDIISTLQVRNETLEKALIKLRDCDWTITLPDRMDAVRDIARQALQEINESNSQEGSDEMPVTGNCDAGCGKPAKYWFGDTFIVHCGASDCVRKLQHERIKLNR